MSPIVGWKGTQHPFQFDPTTLVLATDARRFELSTIAYSSATGLSTSIELLTGVGFPALARHAEALARELIAAARTANALEDAVANKRLENRLEVARRQPVLRRQRFGGDRTPDILR